MKDLIKGNSIQSRTPRAQITKLYVEHLFETIDANRIRDNEEFSTHQHIRSTMEIIANAFYLPMGDFEHIQKAFWIYRYIIGLDISERNNAIYSKRRKFLKSEDKHVLFCNALAHLSLVFEQRQKSERCTNQVFQLHLSHQRLLCRLILKAIDDMFIHLSVFFKDSTWEFIIVLLMAIANHLFHREERKFIQEDLADLELSSLLTKTLFNAFLQSGMKDQKLWKVFADLSIHWLHQKPFLINWQSIIFALLEKVLREKLDYWDDNLYYTFNEDKQLLTKDDLKDILLINYYLKKNNQISYDSSKLKKSKQNVNQKRNSYTVKIEIIDFQIDYKYLMGTDQTLFLFDKILYLFRVDYYNSKLKLQDQLIVQPALKLLLTHTENYLIYIKTINEIINKFLRLNKTSTRLDNEQDIQKVIPRRIFKEVDVRYHIAQLFLKYNHSRQLTGNELILKIFGKWLFEASIHLINFKNQEINGIALSCLSKIFYYTNDPFNNDYNLLLFKASEAVLKKNNDTYNQQEFRYQNLYPILKASKDLFLTNYPINFKNQLGTKLLSAVHINFMRGNIISLKLRFPTIQLISKLVYHIEKPQIKEVFKQALKNEKQARYRREDKQFELKKNLELLLSTILLYIVQKQEFSDFISAIYDYLQVQQPIKNVELVTFILFPLTIQRKQPAIKYFIIQQKCCNIKRQVRIGIGTITKRS